MVDVGGKTVTRRTARARSVVQLPPHVLSALQGDSGSGKELTGPKVGGGQVHVVSGFSC